MAGCFVYDGWMGGWDGKERRVGGWVVDVPDIRVSSYVWMRTFSGMPCTRARSRRWNAAANNGVIPLVSKSSMRPGYASTHSRSQPSLKQISAAGLNTRAIGGWTRLWMW